jgi:hypothetical protein
VSFVFHLFGDDEADVLTAATSVVDVVHALDGEVMGFVVGTHVVVGVRHFKEG